jgi:hypothetical protein
MNAVLQDWFAKVDDEVESLVGLAEVGEELRFEDWMVGLDRFGFNDDEILDDRLPICTRIYHDRYRRLMDPARLSPTPRGR